MRRVREAALLTGLLFTAASAGAIEGDPTQGGAIATSVCATCHGADGNSLVGVNPNLAGQHAEYLYKQLRDYKSGERKNPIMSGMAAALSDQDMRNVAAYFAAQTPRAAIARDVGLVVAGQRLYRGGNADSGVPACAGCHSPDGAGVPVQYPRLKGQHHDYTLAQLKAFGTGERANDSAGMMRAIAARMTEREMQAVAEYVAGLK